jgi:UDP-N-acetylglucosamine 2-epimerase (non-hydrolysing)
MIRDTVWAIDCIVGARPNFVKIAPILRALQARGCFRTRLIHTGQHYDVAMNAVFFDELAIPEPDINLEVGSGSHTRQTAQIMLGLEEVFTANRPDMIVAAGDVNSTLATSLVAAKLLIPLAHVEAGLRSNDRTMPEEINRLVTDRLSDVLITTEQDAAENLLREGVSPGQIHFAGNVMIDTLHACLERAVAAQDTMAENGAAPALLKAAQAGFGFVTLHRPSNVDNPAVLSGLLQAFADVARDLPLVFAMHPRTAAVVAANGLQRILDGGQILMTPPLSYLRSLGLMREAKLVITDSGGMQEETTALGVPCLTVRENTERPITISEGTNELIGTSPDALRRAVWDVLKSGGKRGRVPEFWDGKAAERIAAHLHGFLRERFSSREAGAPAIRRCA